MTSAAGDSREERIRGILDHLVEEKRRREHDSGGGDRRAIDHWRQELARAVGAADPGYTDRRPRM